MGYEFPVASQSRSPPTTLGVVKVIIRDHQPPCRLIQTLLRFTLDLTDTRKMRPRGDRQVAVFPGGPVSSDLWLLFLLTWHDRHQSNSVC